MKETLRLDGRVIVVTGATGIAAAAARRFVAEGASVFTMSVDGAECEALHNSLAESQPGHAWAVADLAKEGAAVEAFEACLDRFSTIDGLFAVAGGSGRSVGDGALDAISLDAWQATLDLNLTTSFLSVREAVRHMLAKAVPGGSIVVTSSVLAEHPSPERFSTHAYSVSKGAQLALVRATAAHYAPHHIRVNAIAPGLVLTPMSARAQEDEDTMRYVTGKQPLAGGGIPAEAVAEAAGFLLSDESRFITGQTLTIDAGWNVSEASS